MKPSIGSGGDSGPAAQNEPLIAKVDQLIEAMGAVANQSGLKTSRIENMQRKQRRFMAALAVLFALICVVLVMVVLVGLDVRQQSREIKNIQDKTTTRVLCPLYQQFINADTPKARELARMSGQDMQVREQAFAVIRQGYEALNCESTTKE